jgi:hypothetical protein
MSATPALAAAPDQPIHESVETTPAEPAATNPDASAEVSPANTPSDASQQSEPAPAVERPDHGSTLPPVVTQGEREAALAQIKSSTALPLALRERLATLVEANGHGNLPLGVCLEALEESLPDFLSGSRAAAAQPPHPAGDVFFRGSGGELSDTDAEALAHRQLSQSGLLRGQRVRVAD